MSRYLIVGVDPGTTTAVAALDFSGGVVGVTSSKGLGLSGVIEYVTSLGRPSVVACDVASPPDFVSKVAASFGAVLFHPQEPLTVGEKIELTRGFEVGDSHQRDALAAAIVAYSRFRNKFEKIDSLGLDDDVKHLVLRGTAIGKALQPQDSVAYEAPERREPAPARELSDAEKKLRTLEKRVSALAAQVELKEAEVKALQAELAKVRRESAVGLRRDREISSRENTIRGLRSKISVLEMRAGEADDVKRLVKVILEGRVSVVGIYPEITGGLTMVKAILNEKDLPKLKAVRVFFTSELKNKKLLEGEGHTVADPKLLERISDINYISKKDLEQIKQNKKISLEEIVGDYRRRSND